MDVQFLVLTDGSVSEVSVVGADLRLASLIRLPWTPCANGITNLLSVTENPPTSALASATALHYKSDCKTHIYPTPPAGGRRLTPSMAKWLSHHLGVFCPDSTVTLLNHKELERWCETDAGHDCDIVLITAFFGSSPEDPKAKGLEILRRLRGRAIFPAVIMVAMEGNELTAVRALQLGAVDYLPKRLLTPERLNTSVRLAVRRIEKRVQRKIATAPHVTGVGTPPADETTRQQPKINVEAAASPEAASLGATPVAAMAKGRRRRQASAPVPAVACEDRDAAPAAKVEPVLPSR